MIPKKSKERKIFLNCMNSWLSNFIIEELRTDYIPDAKIKNIFMGTIDLSGGPIPLLFEPKKTQIEIGYNYNQEVFDNDIFIYNLDDSNLAEVDFIIRGLQTIKLENEKMLILISNIMTWAKTGNKTFSDEERSKEDFDEEEVPEIEEEEIVEKPKIIPQQPTENEEKEKEDDLKSEESKVSKSKKLNKKDKKSEKNDKNDKKNDKKDNKKNDKKDSKKNTKEKVNDTKTEEEKSNNDITSQQENQTINNQPEVPPPEEISKKKEPKIKTYYYKESEYQKRIPVSNFLYYKILENLALSINNPNLKVYIICPGFIYGCGEDFFYDYFAKCWEGTLEYMPVIGDADNHIPTIHVLDLVNIIKRVIERKPDINYIYACDRTKNPTLKNIIKSISNGIGGIDIKLLKDFNTDDIDLPRFAELNIDVRFKTSSLFNDDKRYQGEDIEDYNDRLFKWHCEFGIPENINLLREEFNLYRDIKPISIILLGPPCGGKSTLSKIISEKLKVQILTIDKICEWARKLNSPFGEEARAKWEEVEENVNKAADEYERRKNKKKTDPPFDPNMYRKFSPEFLCQVIKNKISQGECISSGYIMENYPKTYEDCLSVFGDIVNENKENGENNEENKENNPANNANNANNVNNNTNNNAENNTNNIVINKNLLPMIVIIINNYTEESLKEKLKKIPDYEERQIEIDARFNRRFSLYKSVNETNDETKKSPLDFFKENNVNIFYIDESKYMNDKEEQEKLLLDYFEQNGIVDNCSKLHDEEQMQIFREIITVNENNNNTPDEQISIDEKNSNENIDNNNSNNNSNDNSNNESNNDSKSKKAEETNENKQKEDEAAVKSNNNEDQNIQKTNNENENENENVNEENNDEVNESNNSKNKETKTVTIEDKINEMKEREKILLEKKSEVLRRYLSENIMPLLTKGILNVCQNMPDDPVEALANFLLDNSLDLEKENKDNNEDLIKIINESIQ